MPLDDALRDLVRAAVVDAVAPLALEIRGLRAALDAHRVDEWTTRQALAARLGVSLDTVDRRAAASDGIEIRRVGRAVRVRLLTRATDIEVARLSAQAVGSR